MKDLIEKYFKGETSQQEEAKLKAYFLSGDVDESLIEFLPLFQFFAKEKQLELSTGFEEKLFGKIDAGNNGMTALIEKYFAGNTSLDEEATLKTYFNSGQVDTSHKQYQPLFQFFENEKDVELSADFDKKLFEKIDGGGAKIIQMRSWQRKLMRVAAVAIVLFGAYLFFNKPINPEPPTVDWSAHEINDEQLAYEETVKALRLLSSKLNKGKNKTKQEVAKAEPVTKYLN